MNANARDTLERAPRLRAATTIATLFAGAWRSDPPPLMLPASAIQRVLPLVAKMKIAPLVWWRLRQSGHAELQGAAELRDAYRYATLEAEAHQRNIAMVLDALRAASIEALLIKGWDIARHYPHAGLRRYEDIDIVVRPQELKRAQAALARHDIGDAIVDLDHVELYEFDVADWDGLFARSRVVEAGFASVRLLSPEDHLRAICIHGLKHGFSSAVWLCDIAAALESVDDDFDADRLFGAVEPQAQWIACAIDTAREILGCALPAAIEARLQPTPAWLVPAVLDGWITALDPAPYPRAAIHEFIDRPDKLAAIIASRRPNFIEAAMSSKRPFSETHPVQDWSQELRCLFTRRSTHLRWKRLG